MRSRYLPVVPLKGLNVAKRGYITTAMTLCIAQGQNPRWLQGRYFLGGPHVGKGVISPHPLGVVIAQRGENPKWLPNPYLLGCQHVAQVGRSPSPTRRPQKGSMETKS